MTKLTKEQFEALDLSAHTLVTANAGSGKTFILTKRFLETIQQKKIRFNQIVAITFTEKAASELLSRISSQLDEILNNTKNFLTGNEYQRLREFRQHILSAKISTIHSFCFDILKEFPVEAEIDPSTEVIDEITRKDFIEKSIEETLIENLENENVKDILRIFGKDTTIKFIENLINKRYFTDILIDKIYNFNVIEQKNFEQNFLDYFEKINETAQKYFTDIYHYLFLEILGLFPQIKNEVTLKKGKEELIEKINGLENQIKLFTQQLDFKKLDSIFEAITQILLTRQDWKVRKTYFKNADENSAITQFQKIINNLKDFYEKILWDKEFEKEKYKLTLTVIDLYKKAKEKYHYFKTLEGSLDFDDLLILTDKLLENENIRNQLKNRYFFVLVDEFQDTDTIQFNIIKKLTDNFNQTNIVFAVGDEKQSIYGFRNAQLSVFQDFKNFLKSYETEQLKSKVVTLSTNYRSAPSIAAFVNYVFGSLWKSKKVEEVSINYHQEVEYSPLKVGREKFSDENITIIVNEESESQPDKIGNYILELIKSDKKIFDREQGIFRKIGFGDFALLFRTRDEIKDFEFSFFKKQIPFVVSGGRGYFQSEEIRDWINYLNFLANPSSDDALLSILRSPFFALDDNLLLKISQQQGENFFNKLYNLVQNQNYNRILSDTYNILEKHLQISSRYTIPELLQTILDDTLYFGKIDYHPKRFQIIANIKKLINLAHKFETSGLRDLKSFSLYLKDAFEKEDTAEATLSEIKGSVQFMTIHQAKGLEFPIVILPNFERNLQSSSIKYGEISINDYFGFCFKLKASDGENYHTLSSFFGNKINEKIDFNEQLRVLYVALTRATEKLVISFYHKSDEKKNNSKSFKQILLDQLPPINLDNNNSLEIDTKLSFIEKTEEEIREITKNYKLKIDVVKDLNESEEKLTIQNQNEKLEASNLKLFLEDINEKVKQEIFTATQLNVFNQCPTKFLLKFVIGYNPLKITSSEFNFDEKVSGADFGLLFHQLMEKIQKPDLNEAKYILENLLANFPQSIKSIYEKEVLKKFSEALKNELFQKIILHPNSLREFEIIIKFGNHFLLGILDRINLDDNRITIIDYKTDTFSEENFDEKVKEYITQMEFYTLITSEYFKNSREIHLVLFFINLNKYYQKQFHNDEIIQIKKKFIQMLEKIESLSFEKNLDNCKLCEYAKFGRCIL